MSRGDGTGPSDQGPGTGRGLRRGRVDGGRGKGPGFAAGPGGSCICPSCGTKISHQIGIPCFEQKCPKCETAMTRE